MEELLSAAELGSKASHSLAHVVLVKGLVLFGGSDRPSPPEDTTSTTQGKIRGRVVLGQIVGKTDCLGPVHVAGAQGDVGG